MKHKANTNPPGRKKIISALSQLMRTKDFHSVTTAEIAEKAGVTEGLIYKYFKGKKDLLYQVLNENFTQFNQLIQKRIAGKASAIEKLEIIIGTSLENYSTNRVFARILMLEVRNSQDYFGSDAYRTVKDYARTILELIREGIDKGELKSDTDPLILRRIILGAIEHACLGEIIFSRDLDSEATARRISTIIFNGTKS